MPVKSDRQTVMFYAGELAGMANRAHRFASQLEMMGKLNTAAELREVADELDAVAKRMESWS
jgi:hypothetical protein